MSRRSPGITKPSGPGQATRTVAGGVWQVLDKDRQDRLRRAGERYQAIQLPLADHLVRGVAVPLQLHEKLDVQRIQQQVIHERPE